MSTNHIIAGGEDCGFVEIPKIAAELRKKYAEEIRLAPSWKKIVIEIRIRHEATRIFSHRL